MSRGGARTTGLVLANNTSKLSAIGFKWYRKTRGRRSKSKATAHVTVAVGDRRFVRSVDQHGELEALRQVIQLRTAASLPAPTLRQAAKALRAFLAAKA